MLHGVECPYIFTDGKEGNKKCVDVQGGGCTSAGSSVGNEGRTQKMKTIGMCQQHVVGEGARKRCRRIQM